MRLIIYRSILFSKIELTRLKTLECNFDLVKTILFSKLLLDAVQA